MVNDVLDLAVIGGLHELGHMSVDGPVKLQQLIRTFIADASARMGSLEVAVRDDNAAEVRAVAHSLAGSSANLGAPTVAAISRRLEARAVAADLSHAAEEVRELRLALEAAISALQAEFVV